jgi:GntP family gluconate:H+ symporter
VTPTISLLLSALAAVIGLVVLVARFKVHAFLALILASLFVGLTSGLELSIVAKTFQEGVGNTLGSIAVVVGLGTMLGKMLAESRGAEVVANTFLRATGTNRLPWTLMFVAFIVGTPVFFAVGLVLLMPLLVSLVRETKLPVLLLGIPLVAGLSVSHGLVPPHPGPMVAIEKLHADVGKTILYALVVGLPVAVLAGPLFGAWVAGRVPTASEPFREHVAAPLNPVPVRRPGFVTTLVTILLPVLLMLLATCGQVLLAKEHPLRPWTLFIGSPLVALLAATLLSFYTFGASCGLRREQILKFMDDSVGPAANILLVVGAGGGFSKVLEACGTADAIASIAKGMPVSPLLLGWCLAAAIRVAVGSATVAITLSSGLMAPIVAGQPHVSPELLVLALGSGSIVLSHLNDGGFWFVKEYFNLTVAQTLKSWTVMETLIGVATLLLVLALDALR